MLNIVLFGPPGAGKGTQSEKIIIKYQLVHLSTGDILRAEIANQTKLGMEAKQFMDKGALVPDSVVIGMIANKLDANKSAKGFIFDGFPRTLPQGEALNNKLKKNGLDITAVLSLEVNDEALIDRLLKRGQISGRSDDNDDTIKSRLHVYHQQTEPLKEYYAKQNKLVYIPGEGTIDEVFNSIEKAINNLTNG